MGNQDIVNDFNSLVLELASQISQVCPTSFIANNLNILQHIVKTKPKKVIDIFVEHVLKYKPQIDEGDETFFMNNTYSSDIGSDNDLSSKVFEFKTIWKQLSRDNKDIVIKYMQYMCHLALSYIS